MVGARYHQKRQASDKDSATSPGPTSHPGHLRARAGPERGRIPNLLTSHEAYIMALAWGKGSMNPEDHSFKEKWD